MLSVSLIKPKMFHHTLIGLYLIISVALLLYILFLVFKQWRLDPFILKNQHTLSIFFTPKYFLKHENIISTYTVQINGMNKETIYFLF